MYFLLVFFSTILFTTSSFFTYSYQKAEGTTLEKSIKLSFFGSFFSIIMLFLTGLGEITFSLFSLIVAFIAAACNIILNVMTVKVLSVANLTLFSLFSQIGGMLLPSVVSIIFYGEAFTLNKIICMILLVVALIIGKPVIKSGDIKSKIAIVYYFSVFFMNGVVAALSKIHQAGKNAASSNTYTLMQKVITFVITAVILAYFYYKNRNIKFNFPIKSTAFIASSGILNTIANLILLYALFYFDASVEYPLVTGGIILVSVVFDLIMGKKTTKRSLISVAITCIAIALLII